MQVKNCTSYQIKPTIDWQGAAVEKNIPYSLSRHLEVKLDVGEKKN